MRSLKKTFPFIFTFILFASCRDISLKNGSFGQYATDSTYSRATASNGKFIYIGNSDGYIYKFNTRSGRSKKITKQALPELRDIHVIGRNKVVAMQSADSSHMIYLKRRKESVFQVSKTPVFLDGMDILPSGYGLLMGDPVDGYFSLYKTSDSGKTWTEIQSKIKADEGEAGFAASGTTVQCLNDSTYVFVSGGMRSRFFKTTNSGKNWTFVDLPFQKSLGSGAFSMLFINEKEGIVVGGDYLKPSQAENTCFYTKDGGKTWTASEKPPLGYRSSIVALDDVLYACGTTGIDYSFDQGKNWKAHLGGNYIKMLVVDSRLFVTVSKGKIVEFNPISSIQRLTWDKPEYNGM